MSKFTIPLTILLFIHFSAVAFGEPILPGGDNVVTEGVPEIPLELAQKVNRYGEYRTAQFMAWHPERLEMLVLTRFGNTTQVHRVVKAEGRREQLTFFPEPVRDVSAWSRTVNKEFFTFSMDVGGDEFYQLFSLDLLSRELILLSDGKKRNSSGVYSEVAGLLAYARTDADVNGAFTEIHTVDPLDSSTDRLLCTFRGGGWNPTDWSPDGKKVLALEYLSINESHIWEIDLRSGAANRLTPVKNGEETIAYGPGLYGPQGKGVIFTTDADSEFRQLVYADSDKRRAMSKDVPWDVEGVDVSPNGKYVAYLTNAGGGSELYVIECATGKTVALPKVPVGVMDKPHWHNDSRHLAFSLSSATVAGDVFVVDVQGGEVERWTYSESVVDSSECTEPDLVEWKSFDGRSITGFLYRPPVRFTGKRPVIINIHGGPEGQSRPEFLGRMNYFVNELGIALVFPNVRGSQGFGKSFLKLDNGLLREDTHKDISALLDWIGSREDLDAGRIMVRGGSYGGYMTLNVAYRFSDRIACSVDIVGISNLRTFLQNTQGYRRDLRRAEYGDERNDKLRKWMDESSAIENVDSIRKPLLVLQGANDPRVPKSESDQIVTAVKEKGTPVWYVVFNDEGHGFRKKSNADFAFYSTVLFTQEFLLSR